MSLFEKISYSVFLSLVGIIAVIYFLSMPNNELDIYAKALITEEEAADYLSMDKEQFEKIIKTEEVIKEEALGMKIDANATLQWWTYDDEKYFSPAQINKWIEYNMARSGPIIPE